MSGAAHWESVWRSRAPDAVSWHQPVPAPSLAALAGCVPDAPLIDIGGGASTLVAALLDRGWTDLTVLDISAAAGTAALAGLGSRAGRVAWITVDVTRWTPPRRWRVWHDRAVFHFLTDADARAGYLAALTAGTAPGARVVIAAFAPDGPPRCSGLPVRRRDAAGLAADLGPGFIPDRHWREVHTTPGGTAQPFTWAVFTRAA